MIHEVTEQVINRAIGQHSVPSRLGEKTTLGPIRTLLERMGHPERSFPSIHVGGTSGKGSTATFLANILMAAGYHTGLFTKPHLHSVRERFVIDGSPITPEAMLALLEQTPTDLDLPPTWFELITAMMFQHFANQRVDAGVIEVGLGGTLDATNVLLPELCILTNVGLDHTDVLGNTVEAIASDKVGIFKPGRPVVCGARQPAVIEIVKKRCRALGAPLALLGRDFACSIVDEEQAGSVFDFEYGGVVLRDITVMVAGRHQVQNAALAIAAALQLRAAGWQVPDAAILAGIGQTRLPGRLDILPGVPALVLDGAHSPPKMEALAQSIQSLFADKPRRIAVLAFSKGHAALDSFSALAPLLDCVILTEFDALTDYGDKRAQDPRQIAADFASRFPHMRVLVENDPFAAVALARQQAGPYDLICVTGSIFLVGQLREYLMSIQGEMDVRDS